MMYRSLAVVSLLALVLPPRCFAQTQQAEPQAVPQRGLNPESFYGKDSTQGVYVRDSATALEKFAQAQRMERLKEWNKSADVYQEILEKYADRVVPSQIDNDNNIYQYTSVSTAVQEKLARWPAEGLDVYRARYESVAAGLLQTAARENPAALHKIFSLYFVTDSGKAAGLRLVELYLESGEFPAAAWLGDRMLSWHPNLLVERPKLLYRVALAYHLSGDDALAKQRLAELKQKYADAKGTVRGKDVVLAPSLEQELAVAAPVAQDTSADSWPMFAGSPDRSRVSDAGGRPGASAYSPIEFAKPNWKVRGIPQPALHELLQRDEEDRAAGSALGVMPVVDRGEMFFQDGTRVYAVSLDTGMALPGWLQTYGLERNGQYAINSIGTPRGTQLTITLTDDSVFAVMGQTSRMAMFTANPGAPVDRSTRLVCLDRASGKEKWVATAAQFPEEAAALRTLDLTGSPVVVGDGVYVMGRTGKGVQFEDCYVVCFDANTGKYRWSCYVASANTGNQMWGDVAAISDNVSHIAYASGRLYVLTNLGAVAALDAYGGRILWLNIYPRELTNEMIPGPGFRRFNRGGEMPQPARPWTFNPVIVEDGRVFILPSDGKHILVYDAGSGLEIKRISTSDLANADTLLGVDGDRLVVAGEKRGGGDERTNGVVECVNWKKYDAHGFNPDDGDVVLWKADQLAPIRGRGFVTTDSAFIPTERRLVRIGLRNGKIEQRYPQWNDWDADNGRGNILVTQNHVILAGDRRVEVFTDLAMARARLDKQVAAAGNNPEPRLLYAEMMYASGQLDLAAQKLDEAIELLGGSQGMRTGPARDRAFSDALTFAQKLIKDTKEGSQDLAARFFDRAGAAASTPAQQVLFRRNRARLEEQRQHFTEQVKLYQEILTDPALRAVIVPDDEGNGSTTAAVMAEQAIDGVIKRAGASCYEPFEMAAAAAFAATGRDQDATKFTDIAQAYPNSKIAPRAMMAAADSFEIAGKPQQAAHVLRQVLFKYSTGFDKADVLEGLARNYLALNRIEVAISRLSQGDKMLGDQKLRHALRLPNGQILQDVTFGQALDALRKYDGRSLATRLPDFHLPPVTTEPGEKYKKVEPFVPQTDDSVVEDVSALVAPLPEFTRYDRVVAWSAEKGLRVHAIGGATPLLTNKVLTDTPLGLAWVGEDLIVWSGKEIARVQGGGGTTTWKAEVKTLPTIEIVTAQNGEDDAPPPAAIRPNPDAIVMRQQQQLLELQRQRARGLRPAGFNPAVMALQAQGGANAPEQIVEVRPAGDRVLATTSTGRVIALDLANGQLAWQTRLCDKPIERLLATEDFTVVRFSDETATHIVVLDTFGGQQVSPRRNFVPSDPNGMFANGPRGGVENSTALVNLALAPDGTLVFTLSDRICGKDLYDPGSQLTYEVPIQPESGPVFSGATRPDQLIVAEGRILALSSLGEMSGQANGVFVRIHSLENGKPLQIGSNKEMDALLGTGAKDWDVGLRFSAPYLYTISPRKVTAFNLDRPGPPTGERTIDPNSYIRDAFIGQDHLVLLDGLRPNPNNAIKTPPQPSYRLLAHSRASAGGGESGVMEHMVTITDRSGILQWQPVEGGFYYLTGSHQLHLLRGTRP